MNTCALCVMGKAEREKAGYRQASLYKALLSIALNKSVFLKHDHYVADKKETAALSIFKSA